MLAGTNPVPPRLRGRLTGICLAAQNLGRAIGPALFGVAFGWSISDSGRSIPFVDHRFVFVVLGILSAICGVLCLKYLTEELVTRVVNDHSESQGRVAVPECDDDPAETGVADPRPIIVDDRRVDLL